MKILMINLQGKPDEDRIAKTKGVEGHKKQRVFNLIQGSEEVKDVEEIIETQENQLSIVEKSIR